MEWYDEKPHDIKMFYTEQEFSDAEFSAIEKAREQAILNKYGNFFPLGTGSYKMSHVYKTTSKSGSGLEEAVALKIISGITQECDSSNLEISKNQLKSKLRSNEFENSAESEIKLQYDGINRCPNVIPLDGTDFLDWICPAFKRVGVDYVLKMPLADCLSNAIGKIKSAENRISKVIQLGIDICKALESLHAQGIYHRDIKPANIYLYNGNYCLGDFGISIHKNNLKLYEIGTEEYCAPEQHYRTRATNPWLCKKYNHRIDIYSLGLVLYELAGEKPVNQLFTQRMKDALPDLSTESEGLNKIIHTACQFDPDDRYQNATIFKENLERLQQDKNYITSQEVHITMSDQTIAENNLQQPDGDTYIGKEKDPYDDEFGPTDDEEKASDSIVNSMWNVGLFWYEKSQEETSRFANFEIDKNIMPLTSIEQEHLYDFPVKFHSQGSSEEVPLSRLIANINNIKNMYLIGEGGSGKTTALYSIMQNTYKGQMYPIKYLNKITIPLFIELSKAPDICGKAYKEGHSSFIRRYIYLLIKSAQQKTELLTENNNALREVLGTGNDYEQDDIVNTIDHLLNEDNGIRFLLLLDGLNEVSRKTISFSEGSAAVAELIVDEIQEIQECKNVTIIITSRADEVVNLGNDFAKYYLSGIDNTTIKQYLKDNKVSDRNLEQNPRLLTTLRNPFFLKLYCRLIFKSGISTPGEILYNFFKERTSMYSLRNRINTITSEQSVTGSTHVYNRITEKMQWFILDFILPEIGWYMEKNSLYSVDLSTIESVITPILTGTKDTDVCGQYGISFFKDYHKGVDGSKNTRTYAKYLVELTSSHQTYVEAIAEYCVYSLGILYVNNQSYGFIHQHIRDFYSALKHINTMRMALSISDVDAKAGYNCLSQFNKEMLRSNVSVFIGEILSEYKEKSIRKDSLIESVINLYRKKFDQSDNVGYGIYNLLNILYNARKSLAALDLSYLDLRSCHFNGVNLEDSVLNHSILFHDNLFPFGHMDTVIKAIFSNTGEYIYTASYDGTVKLWHASNLKHIKTVIKIDNTSITNIDLSSDNRFLLVSTPEYSALYETQTYKKLKEYKKAFTGAFDANNQYLALAYYRKPIQLINLQSFEITGHFGYLFKGKVNGIMRKNILLFSPDSRYLVFVNTELCIEVWNLESLLKMGIYNTSELITAITFDSHGEKLGIAYHNSQERFFEIIEFHNLLQKLELYNEEDFVKHISNTFKQKYKYTEIVSLNPNSVKDILAVKFIDDDRYFLTADSNGCIQLYDSLNSNAIHVLQGDCSHQTYYISEYKKGYDDYIVSGGDDGTIHIWNLKTLQCTGIIPNGHSGYISRVRFSPDGNFIVIASKDVTIWNAHNGTFEYMLKDRKCNATSLSFSVTGRFLAVGFENGILALYEYKNDKFIQIFEEKVFHGMISNLEFNKNESFILISATDSIMLILDMCSMVVTEIKCNANIAWHSVFFPKDDSILYCNCQSVEKLPIAKQKCSLSSPNIYDPIQKSGLGINTYNSILYCDRQSVENSPFPVPKYDVSKTNSYNQVQKNDLALSVYAAEYIICSPDNKYVVFAWYGGTIEIRSSEDLNTCIVTLFTGTYKVRDIVFSPDSNYMAIIICKSGMKIYETEHWNCVRHIHGSEKKELSQGTSDSYYRGHARFLISIDCHKDNQTFISASADNTVKLWKPFSEKHQTPSAIKKSKRKKGIHNIYNLIKEKGIVQYIQSPYSTNVDNSFLDVYKCEYTLRYMSGLKLKNTRIKDLHPLSDLSDNDRTLLKIYGAIVD